MKIYLMNKNRVKKKLMRTVKKRILSMTTKKKKLYWMRARLA